MAQVCLILSVLLWGWRFRYLPPELKRLGPFLIITLIVQFYSVYLARKMIPNLHVLHIYTWMEFLSWSFFYGLLFRTIYFLRKGFPYFTVFMLVLLVGNSFFLEPMDGFNSYAKTVVQLLLMTASLGFFFMTFGKIDLSKPLPFALVFINFAVLFYYSGSLFIFMFSKTMMASGVSSMQQNSFWVLNALIYILFLILILFSLWKVSFPRTVSWSRFL